MVISVAQQNGMKRHLSLMNTNYFNCISILKLNEFNKDQAKFSKIRFLSQKQNSEMHCRILLWSEHVNETALKGRSSSSELQKHVAVSQSNLHLFIALLLSLQSGIRFM